MEVKHPPRMVVKIQLPLNDTHPTEAMALVYNEDRSFQSSVRVCDMDVGKYFDHRMKQFFVAYKEGERLCVEGVAPWQEW